MNPGEIYWIDFPAANGHEQSGNRPGVILMDDMAAGTLPVTLTVPLTTVLAAATRYPGTVLVDATSKTGLRSRSVALVFQLRVIDRRRVHAPIGQLDVATLQQIFRAFDVLTGRIPPTNKP